MNSIPDKLAENEYYHGTEPHKAIQILYEGFRLKKYHSNWGSCGTFKQGLYLTKSLSSVRYFGEFAFKCRLKKGVAVLKIDEKYDPNVIDYLKREFSKDILTGSLSKVIPPNKHLTKNELIHLLNYRFSKAKFRIKESKKWGKWFNSISSLRQHLQFHKYDGFGEVKHLDGLVIFNPSLVESVELYELFQSGEKLSDDFPGYLEAAYSLRKLDKKNFIVAIDSYYKEIVELYTKDDRLTPEDVKEWDYIRSLQLRYCQENGLV